MGDVGMLTGSVVVLASTGTWRVSVLDSVGGVDLGLVVARPILGFSPRSGDLDDVR